MGRDSQRERELEEDKQPDRRPFAKTKHRQDLPKIVRC